MAAYSDDKLRALIAEMINISEASKSVGDPGSKQKGLVGTDSSYRPSSVLFSMFKSVFSVAGFTSLVGAGLIFEKNFTLASLGAAANEVGDFFSAFSKASKSKGNKIEDFLSIVNSDIRVNTYKYLKEIQKLDDENESLTATIVKKAYLAFKRFFSISIDDPEDDDYEIYTAFMNNRMEDVFTPGLFKVENKKFTATKPESSYTKILDKKIYNQIKEASNPNDDKNVRKSKIRVAYSTYNAAIEMGKGPDELGVTSIIVMANHTPGYLEGLVSAVGDAYEGLGEIRQAMNDIRDGVAPGNNPQSTNPQTP